MTFLSTRNRIPTLLGLVSLFLLAISTLALGYKPASAEGNPARSAVGEDLVVEKGERVVGHVSVTNGNLIVRGEVTGNAIVVGGSAVIEGKVAGNVYVFGDVTVRSTGSVSGEIDYSGTLIQEQGAKVAGAKNKTDMPTLGLGNNVSGSLSDTSQSVAQLWRGPFERIGTLLMWGLVSLVALALSVVLVIVAPRRVRVASATLVAEGRPSVTLGIIIAALLGPITAGVIVLLMVTVVGWVLIPVVVALLVVALSAGLAIMGVWLGRRIYETTHPDPAMKPTPMLVQMLLGMAALLCSTVVPAALVPVGWIAATLLTLLYVAGCVGLGSILLSKMGTLPPARRQGHHPLPQRTSTPSHTMPLGTLSSGKEEI